MIKLSFFLRDDSIKYMNRDKDTCLENCFLSLIQTHAYDLKCVHLLFQTTFIIACLPQFIPALFIIILNCKRLMFRDCGRVHVLLASGAAISSLTCAHNTRSFFVQLLYLEHHPYTYKIGISAMPQPRIV